MNYNIRWNKNAQFFFKWLHNMDKLEIVIEVLNKIWSVYEYNTHTINIKCQQDHFLVLGVVEATIICYVVHLCPSLLPSFLPLHTKTPYWSLNLVPPVNQKWCSSLGSQLKQSSKFWWLKVFTMWHTIS